MLKKVGDFALIHSILMAAVNVQAASDSVSLWSWRGTPFIITASCLLVLFIASRTIEEPHVGPKMPLPFPSLFNNISIGGFLGSMSFGHIIGTGIALALVNIFTGA